MSTCPECFEELDDFSPCACLVFGGPPKPAPKPGGKPKAFKTSMRVLVEQKLRRQGKR